MSKISTKTSYSFIINLCLCVSQKGGKIDERHSVSENFRKVDLEGPTRRQKNIMILTGKGVSKRAQVWYENIIPSTYLYRTSDYFKQCEIEILQCCFFRRKMGIGLVQDGRKSKGPINHFLETSAMSYTIANHSKRKLPGLPQLFV